MAADPQPIFHEPFLEVVRSNIGQLSARQSSRFLRVPRVLADRVNLYIVDAVDKALFPCSAGRRIPYLRPWHNTW